MSLFGNKFNFSDFIVQELGFRIDAESEDLKSFVKGNLVITVHNSKHVKGYDILMVDHKSINVYKSKFIPKSSIVAEGIVRECELFLND